jgi:hypothetical protein
LRAFGLAFLVAFLADFFAALFFAATFFFLRAGAAFFAFLPFLVFDFAFFAFFAMIASRSLQLSSRWFDNSTVTSQPPRSLPPRPKPLSP